MTNETTLNYKTAVTDQPVYTLTLYMYIIQVPNFSYTCSYI